jgi:hypothetical protein
MVSPRHKIEDRDLTSDCLVTNTGYFAVVYSVIHIKTRQDSLDSRNGQNIIVY